MLPALGVLRKRWSLDLRQLDIPQTHGDPSSDFSVFFWFSQLFPFSFFPDQKVLNELF